MSDPAFERWLRRAVRGLDAPTAAAVRAELTDHYAAAIADGQQAGLSREAAGQAALHALGDSATIAAGFRQAHGARRRYLLAAVAGMLYPPLYLLLMQFHARSAGLMVFNPALFLPLIYIVYAARVLLAERPHGANLVRYEQLIHTGIVAMCVPRLVGWLLYHQPIIAEAYTRTLGEARSLNEFLLNGMALIGLLLAGAGCVALGERTLHLREGLYGLLKPASGLLMLAGGGLLLYCLGTFSGSLPLRESAEALAVLACMSAGVLWALIFLRARDEAPRLA